MLQCVAVCCSVLQCVAVYRSVLPCVAVRSSVLQCGAVCCGVLQCVTVCCSVLYSAVRVAQRCYGVLWVLAALLWGVVGVSSAAMGCCGC